jgi:hypothetical protein
MAEDGMRRVPKIDPGAQYLESDSRAPNPLTRSG